MKKTLKYTLPLFLILCISALLMLSGCGGSEVTEAYITNSNLPRTTYVEGQDLDLSKGYLTVVRGGEETNIPFSAEGIAVSGYDKNTLGEQTVTFTYEGKATTLKVNVVRRMVFKGIIAKYGIQKAKELNEKYKKSLFYFVYRQRVYNSSEGEYIGYERKR